MTKTDPESNQTFRPQENVCGPSGLTLIAGIADGLSFSWLSMSLPWMSSLILFKWRPRRCVFRYSRQSGYGPG